jgi:hypothetical protein
MPFRLRHAPSTLPIVFSLLITTLLLLPLQAVGAPRVDIASSALTLASTTLSSGATTRVELKVTNLGRSAADAVAITISLEAGGTTSRAASVNLGRLAGGASATVVTSLTAPTAPGTYTVIGTATTTTRETSTANNTTTAGLVVGSTPTSSPTSTSTTSTSTSTTPTSTSTTSTSSTTTASSTSTASCTTYQSFFDSVLASNKDYLDSMAAAGDGPTYSTFHYALDGMTAMAFGARDPKYVSQALTWAETIIAKATVADYKSYRNWPGPWTSPYAAAPIAYHLNDVTIGAALSEVARVVLRDPSWTATYGSRATTIRNFVAKHIIEKHLVARSDRAWYQSLSVSTTQGLSIRTPQLLRAIVNLSEIGTSTELSWAKSIVANWKRYHFAAWSTDAVMWDLKRGAEVPGYSWDTSRASSIPYFFVRANEAALESPSIVTQLSNLLLKTIWNQSLTDPRFTNFIDGIDDPVYNRAAGGIGIVYHGWAALGAYDPRVQGTMEAVLKALIAGRRNPSLDAMNSVWGKLALAGNLSRNWRIAGACSAVATTSGSTTTASSGTTAGTTTPTSGTTDSGTTTTTTGTSGSTTTSSTSGTTTSSGTPTSSPTPPSSSSATCTKYQSFFDTVSAANRSSFDSQALSGDGHTYYSFSYIIGGTLAMFEGTGDVKYLEQTMRWAETMISSAKIVDFQGRKNWSGPWSSQWASAPISYMLDDFQGSAELARLARVVLSDPDLKAVYGSRAQAVYRFVKDHIVDKWLYARKTQSYFTTISNDQSKFYSDKTAFLVRMLLDLHLVDGNTAYAALAGDLLEAFVQRLDPYTNLSQIWDLSVASTGLDTSHANRFPYMALDAYAAGIKIGDTHLSGLSNLFTRVIWDQSLSSPRFTNYSSGDNSEAFGRTAWGNGQVYSGWVTLGAYDPAAQRVAEAVLAAIIAGVKNPSLDYMSTVYGKVALAGFVTRNMRLSGQCS